MKSHRYSAAIAAIIMTLTVFGQDLPIAMTRDRCREMALTHDETLAKARNGVTQAELDRKIANNARLPRLDGSATGLFMLPDMDMMGSKLAVRGAYVAGLQIVQPIYAGGKITAGRKLADIGRKAADQQLRMTTADVIYDADNTYWTYIAVCDKMKLMESFKAMIDTLYLQTEAAVEAGMTVENDLLRISAKRSEIQYQIEKVTNGKELCRMALCNITGLNPDTPVVATDTFPDCERLSGMQADITMRPEYHLLELQLEAAREQVKLTRGDFLPTVGLSIGYNYYGNIKMKGMADAGGGNYVPFTRNFSDGIAMGLLSVSIPLFHWGEGVRKVKKAKIEVENATLDLNHTASLLDLEARQAMTNVKDGWNMIKAAKTAMDQATENLRVMQDRYDESMVTLTDLLDAQTQWHQSRSNMIEAATQYQIYRTAWLKAAGQLELDHSSQKR